MIIKLKGYDLHLGVLPLKRVQVKDVDLLLKTLSETLNGLNLEFQVLNLNHVAGLRHILISALTALEAMKLGLNVAKRLSMEILVRASGQRQIGKALKLLGVRRGHQDVLVAVLGENPNIVEEGLKRIERLYPDNIEPRLLERDRSKEIMEAYRISEEEIKAEQDFIKCRWEAVKNLVAEKVALTLAT